jgi:hypothetical protein
MPQGYIDAMKQWGISQDWTEKIWAAHWSLPGLQDTFDMYHRGIITLDQLNIYFALTDILPFFRDKLINLNYSLITRVDIRRMYSVGVFNETDVYNAYLKLGYNSENAQKLTQFTVLHERQSEQPAKVRIKALTETMVIKAYKEKLISHNDAITRLGQIGYLANDAELILELETQVASIGKVTDKTQEYHDRTINLVISSLIDGVISESDALIYLTSINVPTAQAQAEINFAKISQTVKLKDIVLKNVKSAYSSGLIDKNGATNFMLARGFTINEINVMFAELDILQGLRNKALTKAELDKLAKAGIISEAQYMQELAFQGYSDQHIQWLVAELFGA